MEGIAFCWIKDKGWFFRLITQWEKLERVDGKVEFRRKTKGE